MQNTEKNIFLQSEKEKELITSKCSKNGMKFPQLWTSGSSGYLGSRKFPIIRSFSKASLEFVVVGQSQGREKWGEPSVISGWWEGEGSQSVSVPMRWLTLSDATNTRPASQSASETRPQHHLTSHIRQGISLGWLQLPSFQMSTAEARSADNVAE